MTLLIQMLVAHFAGDFILQPAQWVREKEQRKARSVYFYLHGIIHLVLLLVLTFRWDLWLVFTALAVSHLFIDWLKVQMQTRLQPALSFIIDQVLHIALVVLVYSWDQGSIDWISVVRSDAFWIYFLAMIMLFFVLPIMVRQLLYPWTKEIEKAEERPSDEADSNQTDKSLKKAGTYIGILERLFVFTFVISGQWQAVGFLIAAKSVFRFGDLQDAKNRKLTEYVLIGTLLSFGSAFGVALLVQLLLSQ